MQLILTINSSSCAGALADGAFRRYFFWLTLAIAGAALTSRVAAATFPRLDSETRLPGTGSLALSGDTAIVGNFVYVRTPAGWLFQQVLDGSGAVALDGDTAVVGPNVYVRGSDTRWVLQATLPFSYDSLALAGDVIAAGLPYRSGTNNSYVGAVFIFTRTNATWSLQSQVVADVPEGSMGFGGSVGLDAQTLVASASGIYGDFQGSPSAYIFSGAGGSWLQQARLTNDHSAPLFGDSVAVNGNIVAVGARDPSAPVTVFVRQSGRWIKQQTLSWGGSYVPAHEFSVNPLGLTTDTLAACDTTGSIHIAARSNSTWTESQLLTTGSTNGFGSGIHLTTNALITAVSNSDGVCIFEPRSWAWLGQDIGNVGAQGNLSTTANVLTISGAGDDIVGTEDAFHFVYRPYSNDLEMVVRVVSIGGSDPWSRGGIMFRGSLDPDAPFAYLSQRQGQQITFQNRSVAGAAADFRSGPSVGVPYWLRMRKLGSNFVAAVSQNGTYWNEFVSTNLSLPSTFYIGLGVTSHQAGTAAADVFDHVAIAPIALPRPVTGLTATADGIDRINLSWADNADNESAFVVKQGPYYVVATLPPNTTNFTVTGLAHDTTYSFVVQAIEPHGLGGDSEPANATTLKLPAPWLDQDIGSVQVPGQAVFNGNGFLVTSGATNRDVDGLHFLYQQWTGDFDFRAHIRLSLVTGNSGGTKAGLMVRAALTPNAPYVFGFVTQVEGNQFQVRNTAGSTVVAPGSWIGEYRIVRRGNTFSVFHLDTENPSAMAEISEQTINLPATVYLGFAVMGQDYAQPVTGNFTGIYLAGGVDVHPVSPPVLTATPMSPTQVRLSWADSNVNPTAYELFYSQTNYNGPGYYIVRVCSSNVTSFVDTSVVPGMTRYYRMLVRLADGDSLWSNFAPATTPLPVFNLPPPWTNGRIGAVSAGAAIVSESNHTFSVWDSGNGMSALPDNCSGIFRPLAGDGSITARFVGAVDANGVTYPTGKFGIMIRQSLDPGAAAAAMFATISPSYGIGFISRTVQGATSSTNFPNNSYAPPWLRLVRSGSAVAAYLSADGTSWTGIGSSFISITNPAIAGLFVSSENSSVLVGATFDNVQIGPPEAPLLALEPSDNGGAIRIQVQGLPGWTNRIEISPDLIHWEPWTNRFSLSGSFDIADPAGQRSPSRFYRALIGY